MRDQTNTYLIYVLIGVIVLIVLLGIWFYPRKEVVIVSGQHNNPQQKENVQMSENRPKPALVLFYANSCGHCHAMMPEWEKFKQSPLAAQIDIMQFEASASKAEMQKNKIGQYPTIKFFPNGYDKEPVIPYMGDRTADAFTNFLVNGPPRQ